MYIYVSFLLKYKIHLYLHGSVKEHLHYATVKYKIQIYIYIMLLEITLSRQAEMRLLKKEGKTLCSRKACSRVS
jgi:hypothetical protein